MTEPKLDLILEELEKTNNSGQLDYFRQLDFLVKIEPYLADCSVADRLTVKKIKKIIPTIIPGPENKKISKLKRLDNILAAVRPTFSRPGTSLQTVFYFSFFSQQQQLLLFKFLEHNRATVQERRELIEALYFYRQRVAGNKEELFCADYLNRYSLKEYLQLLFAANFPAAFKARKKEAKMLKEINKGLARLALRTSQGSETVIELNGKFSTVAELETLKKDIEKLLSNKELKKIIV